MARRAIARAKGYKTKSNKRQSTLLPPVSYAILLEREPVARRIMSAEFGFSKPPEGVKMNGEALRNL
jgi:hypothetical protein